MKLPKLPPVFQYGIIAILVILLLTKNWKCNAAPDHSKDAYLTQQLKLVRDSANKAVAAIDAVKKKDSVRLQGTIDTIKTQLATTRRLLNSSQRKTADLAAGVVISKRNNDTSGYIGNCDSLAGEIAGLNWLIDQYVDYSDSLTRVNESLQVNTATRLAGFKKLYIDEHAAFEAVQGRYQKLYVDYQKVSKRADRKWSVGLGAGIGLTSDGKPGAAIGITVNRTLLRF